MFSDHLLLRGVYVFLTFSLFILYFLIACLIPKGKEQGCSWVGGRWKDLGTDGL